MVFREEERVQSSWARCDNVTGQWHIIASWWHVSYTKLPTPHSWKSFELPYRFSTATTYRTRDGWSKGSMLLQLSSRAKEDNCTLQHVPLKVIRQPSTLVPHKIKDLKIFKESSSNFDVERESLLEPHMSHETFHTQKPQQKASKHNKIFFRDFLPTPPWNHRPSTASWKAHDFRSMK
jgi:hypothetical protein